MLQLSNGSLFGGQFTENFTAATWTMINRTYDPTAAALTSMTVRQTRIPPALLCAY